MQVFHAPLTDRHNPQSFLVLGSIRVAAEQPERRHRLLSAAAAAGHDIQEAPPPPPLALERVHTSDYLGFLRTAHAEWSANPAAAPEVIPNLHPNRHMAAHPHPGTGIVGRAGWYQADGACPIGPHTWEAALASAGCAVAAADAVLAGAEAAYALCRPPGHHAYSDLAGGFCYLNNVAIAAEVLLQRYDRVAILDIDVHHGNGTQGIFWRRADVLTLSIHADPTRYYPYFAGFADEVGEGAGAGFNLNLPLPHGSGDAAVLAALDTALARIKDFDAGTVLIALGLDAADADPLGVFAVSTQGFETIGQRLTQLDRPLVLVQEGGYLCDALGASLAAVLRGVG
ncbi:MAG: histone deacetylase family protein [Alphaproteobacteria bacterium]|nr:MAG: histone deacetylase family protein [Alphaproteobacteria bacterium]